MIVYGRSYYYPLEIKKCENGFYNREIPPINKTSKSNRLIREDNYRFYCKNSNRKFFIWGLKDNVHKVKKGFLENKIDVNSVIKNLNNLEKDLKYFLSKPTSIIYTKNKVVKKYNSVFLDVKV